MLPTDLHTPESIEFVFDFWSSVQRDCISTAIEYMLFKICRSRRCRIGFSAEKRLYSAINASGPDHFVLIYSIFWIQIHSISIILTLLALYVCIFAERALCSLFARTHSNRLAILRMRQRYEKYR